VTGQKAPYVPAPGGLEILVASAEKAMAGEST